MKKLSAFLLTAMALWACTNDDQYSLTYFQDTYGNRNDPATATSSDTLSIAITYNGQSAPTLTGDIDSVETTVTGAYVTITSATNKHLELTLSGTTANGGLLVYAQKKYGITLSNVSITNPNGPAINNQSSKALNITLEGTNTLSDGTTYTDANIDQKGTLFSEGQIYFLGTGTLTVNGKAKNGIASDDYVTFAENTKITVNISDNGSNGVKTNDGVFIQDGTLNITIGTDGGRGIKSDSCVVVTGGTTTIETSGDCKIETINSVADTTSAAGIKTDDVFTMSGGTMTIKSSGDGGKGINATKNVELSGGTLNVSTIGTNDDGKPKAVKSDTGIILSGGSFQATCKKSWACDNGIDTEDPAARVTINGSPRQTTFEKRKVIVIF